jgi:hypothetical protein
MRVKSFTSATLTPPAMVQVDLYNRQVTKASNRKLTLSLSIGNVINVKERIEMS